jgi:hypothetical protein
MIQKIGRVFDVVLLLWGVRIPHIPLKDSGTQTTRKLRDAHSDCILSFTSFTKSDRKALPRPLFTRNAINKTIKGGDVPHDEQPALTTVSTGVVPFTKRVLVSESCGEGCASILIPNVYALNRTRTKPQRGEQAQIYILFERKMTC